MLHLYQLIMNDYPPFIEKKWKRTSCKEPFPNLWSNFVTKTSTDGQVFKIRIQDVPPALYDAFWKLYENYFFPEDEIFRLVKGLDDEPSMKSQRWLFDQCVRENLSLVAVLDDHDTEAILVGGLKLAIVSKEDPKIPTLPGKAQAKLDELGEKLAGNKNLFEELKVDRYIYESGLLVKPEYRRLGIATQLFKVAENVARAFEIPAAVVTLGNERSQALGAKLGYSVLSEQKLSEYVDKNGRMILPAVEDHKRVDQLCFKYL